MDSRDDIKNFFDAFVEAFSHFKGTDIAQRYQAPYFAVSSDGTARCFMQHIEIAPYFQQVLDAYQAQGCRSCRYGELEVVAMGSACTQGTVTWELLDANGAVLTRWRESYWLVHTAAGLRVQASADHTA